MKVAIITGASSGMGRDFVLQLDKTGEYEELWVIARREDRLKSLADETKTPVKPIPLDLTSEADIKKYEALLKEENPDVTMLVNCSGYGKFGRYDQIPLEDCMGMIETVKPLCLLPNSHCLI